MCPILKSLSLKTLIKKNFLCNAIMPTPELNRIAFSVNEREMLLWDRKEK